MREDGNGEVVVAELEELEVSSAKGRHDECGNQNRTTHATESNDESSKSHAICYLIHMRQRKISDYCHSVPRHVLCEPRNQYPSLRR